MNVNPSKCDIIYINDTDISHVNLDINFIRKKILLINEYTYLGVNLYSDLNLAKKLKYRIKKICKQFINC